MRGRVTALDLLRLSSTAKRGAQGGLRVGHARGLRDAAHNPRQQNRQTSRRPALKLWFVTRSNKGTRLQSHTSTHKHEATSTHTHPRQPPASLPRPPDPSKQSCNRGAPPRPKPPPPRHTHTLTHTALGGGEKGQLRQGYPRKMVVSWA